jgi:uncharacterized repeat protein (TIGR02543 family)
MKNLIYHTKSNGMNFRIKSYLVLLFTFLFFLTTNAQNLTISSTGQTGTSGTNWSLASNVLTITGNADVNASVFSNHLASNNLSLSGVVNIYVNAAISWSSNTILTLNASQNILIYRDITASGSSPQLYIYYGGSSASTAPNNTYIYALSQRNRNKISFSSSSAVFRVGNETYTVCTNLSQLSQAMSNATSSTRVALGASINLSQTYTNSLFPINFSGKFDGLGQVIDGLRIRNSGGASVKADLGLFSQLQGATVRNLGITNIDILTNSTDASATGSEFRIGALAGNIGNSSLTSSGYSASAYTSIIESVWSSGNIGTANNYSTDAQSSGDRQKFFFAGGLVGSINNGTANISRCYSYVNVSSSGSFSLNLAIGGLIGDIGININLPTPHTTATNTSIGFNLNKSFTTGSILSGPYGNYYGTGGIIGVLFVSGTSISDCYSWGSAISTGSFGGLIGFVLSGSGPISNLYTTQSTAGANFNNSTNIYTSVTSSSPTSGTTLPTGFSNTVWSKATNDLPVLLDLETPPTILYVRVTTSQSSTCGAISIPYNITNASGTAVTLTSLGLNTPTGSPVFTINNLTPPGTYSAVSYLSGLTLTGANAANYTLNPYPETTASHTITGTCVNYQITFNGNSNRAGSVPANIVFSTSATIPNQNNLVKNGFVFTGWNTNSSGTGTSYAVNSTYSTAANLSLFAQWQIDPNIGCITIVSSGGASENSGWVYANNTIYPSSSSAVSINASDIVSKLGLGELNIVASCISIEANIQYTTNSNSLSIITNSHIDVKANIITNGGNITFWTDYDNNSSGGITVADNVTIDSRTNTDRTNTTHTSGGGRITLAGGHDDGGSASGTGSLTSGLVANDGFPDGYAVNSGSGSSTTPKTGIVLGTIPSTPAGHNSNINIFSGGGHIRLHGLVTNNTGATANDPTGLLFFHGYNINSGTAGNIVLLGNSSVSSIAGAIGMDLAAWRENTYTADGIVRTVNGSINVIGRASGGTSYNIAMAIDGTNTNGSKRNIFVATGNGTISLDGLATGTTPLDIRLTNVDLLSGSGAITVTARGTSGVHIGGYNIGDGLHLGQKTGSLVTSSSSNISLIADNIQQTKPLITNSTGALIIESLSNAFTSNISLSNQTIASTHTSLRIGKTTNTANITTGGTAISIAGPISIYGGVVTTNANITTSNSSSISLLAKSGLRFSSSGITLQTGGGAVVLSGDHDANSIGNIIAEGALTITTNGGAISMGGGATGSDFAYGIGTSSTIANDQTAGIWVRGAVNINSGNGNISIRGYAANASPGIQHVPSWGVGLGLSAVYNTNPASVSINSGTGTILIEGFARNPSGLNTNSFGVVFNNWETTTTESLTITSANTTANAIRLIGNTENTQQGQRTKNSLRFWSVNNSIRATGTGGGITLSGKTFDGNDHPQICWSGGNILATSGPIVINTENEALEIGNDMYVGSRSGITGNTTSSSNVRFSIDDFTAASGIVRVASTGSLTIEPFGNSFTDYTPSTNSIIGFTTASRWSLNENAQTLTGLTIGKPLNLSNTTIGSTTTIAGPITVYGGNLNINENINTTSGGTSGDVLLKAASDITFAKAKTISSTGGDMIFWSDADGNGAGDIFFEADQNTSYTNPVTVSTGGGHLWLGGGSGSTTWNGLTVGNSYATGNTGRAVGGSYTHYNGIMIQGTSINTSGGHIKMRGMGKSGNYSSPFYSGGMYLVGSGTMNSGGGNIEIEAVAQSGNDGNYGLYNLGTYVFAPGSGDLTIFGDASASSASFGSNAVGNGVLLWSGAISSTGNINLSGKKSSGSGTFGVYINVNIATTGTNKNITIETDHLNINGSSPRISSSGQLILKPLNSSTSIGLGGASGTLSLPASYFSTNFTDGFSNIQIGSNSQTGAISSNTFTLRDNMTFLTSGSLSLGGIPVLGSNNVTLGSAISSITASASAYFQTNGTGVVNRTIANSANLLFPIGNALYNPISIANNTGASDVFTAKVRDAVLEDGTSGITMRALHVGVTWDINKTNANASSGVDFTLQWNSSQEPSGGLTSYRLNHYNSSTPEWEFAAGTSGSVSGSTTKTMTHTGYTGTFSPFAIGSGTTPLPVDLVSFDATPRNNSVDLTWTSFGDNKNPFNILKSNDGVNWKSIGTQIPTENSVHYLFTDNQPAPVNYYQLSQIDNSNTMQYSDIRIVNFNSNKLVIFPNPNNGEFTIQSNNVVEFQITDYTGKVIMEGDNSNPLIKSNLTKGIYFIKITEGDKTTFSKMIVQ